jgi:succinate-semialdehyde dehydrogenase
MQDDAMSQTSSQTHAISINPATGEQIGHYAFESAAALDAALTRAAFGFGKWKRKPLQDRSRLLTALAAALRETSDAMATMITQEMGSSPWRNRKMRQALRVVRREWPGDARR